MRAVRDTREEPVDGPVNEQNDQSDNNGPDIEDQHARKSQRMRQEANSKNSGQVSRAILSRLLASEWRLLRACGFSLSVAGGKGTKGRVACFLFLISSAFELVLSHSDSDYFDCVNRKS